MRATTMTIQSNIKAEVVFDDEAWGPLGIDAALITRAVEALWVKTGEPGTAAELSVLLTNDERMRTLNGQFRERDTATNVLSFPSGDDEYIGDVALGVETVTQEAAELAVAVQDHVTHLVIHGTLHLLGYDHQTDDEAEEMEKFEVSVLKDLDIADPYDGRDLTSAGATTASAGGQA